MSIRRFQLASTAGKAKRRKTEREGSVISEDPKWVTLESWLDLAAGKTILWDIGPHDSFNVVMVMASWGKDRAYMIRVDSIVWLDTGQIAGVDKSEEGFDPCSTAQVLVDLIPLRERGDGVSPSTGLGRMITTDLTASFLARGPISVSAIDRIQARNRGNLLCGLVDWRGETWRAGRWTILPL